VINGDLAVRDFQLKVISEVNKDDMRNELFSGFWVLKRYIRDLGAVIMRIWGIKIYIRSNRKRMHGDL